MRPGDLYARTGYGADSPQLDHRRTTHRVLTAAGIAAGQMVWTIAASVGIAGLLQASQPAFAALKIIGAAYLVFLGAQSILAAIRSDHGNEQRRTEAPELAPRRAMRQGFISNLANPKMAAFFLACFLSSRRLLAASPHSFHSAWCCAS